MAIDILNITPHEVSKDLCGYTITFYGEPKTGKTTIASKFPKTLLLAFEVGYLAIPGILAQPIHSWSEFKKVLKQLKSDEAHEQFSNVVIDTADIAYSLCEKYVCSQKGVDDVADLGFGRGYKAASKEFDECLRQIPQMGYGLILISHSQDKVFKDENGDEYNQIVPTLSNQPRLIVDRMSDIIGYAHPVQDEDGSTHTILYMRGTPRFIAGSRFKYTPDYIEFTYDNLVNAISDAIDKQADENDGKFVTETRTTAHNAADQLDFDALMDTFNELIDKLQNATGGNFGNTWAPRIAEIVGRHLGKGKLVSDMDRSQAEQLDLIVADLTEAVGNGI